MSNGNSKTAVTQSQQLSHRLVLKTLLSDASAGNKACADCRGRQPTWASVNLGCFICLTCSGIHRSLGVHISQVRSTTLDTWTADQIAFVQDVGGNTRCNAFWEGALDVNFDRPDGNNVHELKRFIVDKYVNRRYVRRDVGEAVRRMEAGEFGRYYAGVMVRRQGGGEAEEEEDARGKRGVDTVNGVDGARQVVDELLLLDVRDDAAAVADTAQERKDEVDVWGDIEWITGDVAVAATASEHAGTAPAAAATAAAAAREHAGNAPAAAATATAAAPSEKSVDDILALFDR